MRARWLVAAGAAAAKRICAPTLVAMPARILRVRCVAGVCGAFVSCTLAALAADAGPTRRDATCAGVCVAGAVAATGAETGAATPGAAVVAEPAEAAASSPAQEAAATAAPTAASTSPPPAAGALPGFAELEAAGATIGRIRVATLDIFDTSDPLEDNWLFRLANRLHIHTRPEVIERALLFRAGQRVSVQAIDETERLLRANSYLYDVQIRPLAVHDGVVDIEVVTRDTWSLDPGVSVSRQGGASSSGFRLADYNLLGTGTSASIGHSRSVDRSGNEITFSNPSAFGTHAAVRFAHASNSDGGSDSAAIVRPFYHLDARWAAGVRAARSDAIESIYEDGSIVAQYRHRRQRAEIFGGLSQGLVDGWVHRTSLGLALAQDRYALQPGLAAPSALPQDRRLVAPFVRLEVLEDRFERELNRNLVGKPEYFSLGLASALQLGWAVPALGSSQAGALWGARVARGYELSGDRLLMVAAHARGQIVAGRSEREHLGVQAQYYVRQGPRWLFYAAAAADRLTRPALEDLLTLGGDNGLRGFPMRYRTGTRRTLFAFEERFYTDLYLWQLFRIGGATYVDVGRAWGGAYADARAPWLADAGFGLRIVSARSAFSNVLHVDLAFPLNAPGGVRRSQFIVKTKTSF